MKTKSKMVIPVLISLLCGGCVGSGPNTQQGAVTGGTLGALAGAIVGNNSGHGNALNGALIGGAVGAIAGGTMGNQADHQRGTIYGSEAEARTEVEIDTPPPPPPPPQREVIYERSGPEAVWIQGVWIYNGRGYEWAPGHWEVPPPRHRRYVPAHWQRQRHGYIYIRGYWN